MLLSYSLGIKTILTLTLILLAPWRSTAQTGASADTSGALFDAVAKGNVQSVKTLLDAGGNSNSVDREGRLLLTTAAELGHLAIVNELIAAGARVNAKDDWGDTALKQAVEFGFLEVVSALLSSGADANSKDDFGKTPLFNAAHRGDTRIMQALLDAGADVSARDNEGRTVLLRAAIESNSQVVQFLRGAGARTESPNEALLYASAIGDVAAVRELLAKGTAVDLPIGEGLTPLMAAARNGWDSVTGLLLSAGAEIEIGRAHV